MRSHEPAINPSWQRLATSIVVAGSLLGGVAACTSHDTAPRTSGSGITSEQSASSAPISGLESAGAIDLLGGNWQYLPGAVVNSDRTLSLHHTGEQEVLEGGIGYVANPPINTYGSHVELARPSNARVTATLKNIQGAATVLLRSAPATRLDESIVTQSGIAVTIDGSIAHVDLMTLSGAAESALDITLTKPATEATLAVDFTPTSTTVSINGTQATLAAANIGQKLWFGFDTAGTFDLSGLVAAPLAGNSLQGIDTTQTSYTAASGLASGAAAHGHADKQIGTAVDLPALMSNPVYAEFVINNFNEIETELLAKFQALQPVEGQFEFAELDALVDFAAKHNLQVHGHALVFTEANPKWLTDKLAMSTPDQARSLLQNHITTVVSRYDGQHGHGTITAWDVVNEPFDPDEWEQLNQSNPWYKALGPSYITEALQMARAANPQALAGINEWALETDDNRWNSMVHLAKQVRPDFVGFQAHFDEDTLDDDDAMQAVFQGQIAHRFNELARLGIKVRISEASVADNGDPARQAAVYALLLKTCLQAVNCTGFNMWGATNSSFENRPFYFTGDGRTDPGDDAPTTQDATGVIGLKPAWAALVATASK